MEYNDVAPIPSTSNSGKPTKNPRLSAKRSVLRTIHWPHQFVHRPGASDISFDDLSQSEFVAGTCAILLLPELPSTEHRNRLLHMQYLMNLARSSSWERVRNLYAAALEDIQYGQREWGDTLIDLKESMLPIQHQFNTNSTPARQHSRAPNPCRKLNWEECKSPTCTNPHICFYCHTRLSETNTHPAKSCSMRNNKYPSKNGSKMTLLPARQ